MEFIGRDRELAFLEEMWSSGQPELFVLYGRRRVGKTELLQRFAGRRRAVYFQAAQVREKDNLRAFRDALAEALEDPLTASVEFPGWPAALDFVAERARDERLALILDEFPYLCEGTRGLPSIVQRLWDTRAKHSQLMLVLCGSQVSFMEREVLAERSPLFGRRTAQRRLQPLAPSDALRFFPRWDLEDRVLAMSILGGMPAYLRRFDDSRDLRENLLREVFRPEGYLFDEVSFLLRNELSSPATYNSLLAAIARGERKVGDIALSVGVDSTTANKYLTVLRELGLVARDVPITDPDPLRSRRGTYRIADRFLAFHFRHLQPHLSLVNAGRGERVLEGFVEPDLARLFREGLVELVLEHLASAAAELAADEIVETARLDGPALWAAARTAAGGLVTAALDTPRPPDPCALRDELAALETALGTRPLLLRYALDSDQDPPLRVAVEDVR